MSLSSSCTFRIRWIWHFFLNLFKQSQFSQERFTLRLLQMLLVNWNALKKEWTGNTAHRKVEIKSIPGFLLMLDLCGIIVLFWGRGGASMSYIKSSTNKQELEVISNTCVDNKILIGHFVATTLWITTHFCQAVSCHFPLLCANSNL